MHRWIDVGELPFIGGNLAIGMHVPLAEHHFELLFAEIRIDQRQSDHMEGEIPGRTCTRGIPICPASR